MLKVFIPVKHLNDYNTYTHILPQPAANINNILPPEILTRILSFVLDPHDIFNLHLINSYWLSLHTEYLWRTRVRETNWKFTNNWLDDPMSGVGTGVFLKISWKESLFVHLLLKRLSVNTSEQLKGNKIFTEKSRQLLATTLCNEWPSLANRLDVCHNWCPVYHDTVCQYDRVLIKQNSKWIANNLYLLIHLIKVVQVQSTKHLKHDPEYQNINLQQSLRYLLIDCKGFPLFKSTKSKSIKPKSIKPKSIKPKSIKPKLKPKPKRIVPACQLRVLCSQTQRLSLSKRTRSSNPILKILESPLKRQRVDLSDKDKNKNKNKNKKQSNQRDTRNNHRISEKRLRIESTKLKEKEILLQPPLKRQRSTTSPVLSYSQLVT